MDILLKREQSSGKVGRVVFKLWGKVELNEDEKALVQRYRFDEAALIYVEQPGLLRNAIILGLVVAAVVYAVGGQLLGSVVGAGSAGVLAGATMAYLFYDHQRETIFVRDLLHGRHFACDTVIDLARKEARLTDIVAFFRQVMESAKHWDDTERVAVEPLPKDEARQVIIRGI